MSDNEKAEQIKRNARDVFSDGRTPDASCVNTTEYKWETERLQREQEKKDRGW